VSITKALQDWLDGGSSRMGQLLVRREGGGFSLLHHEDAARADLAAFHDPEAAREIARYDDAGKYRPLKSAPNLRHGWELSLEGLEDLRLALDFLYPAALGAWVWRREGRLAPVDFRRTAERQTGMYEIVKRLSDAQADALAGDFCADGKCLKTILWRIAPGRPVTTLPPAKFDPEREAMSLLCAEACNLYVAAARKVVR